MPDSDNPIRSKGIFTKHWLISPCPARVLTNQMFMVRGSRLIISFGYKVIFVMKNNSMGLLHGQVTRWINVINESHIKWVSRNTKLAIEQESLYQTQCGTPSIINLYRMKDLGGSYSCGYGHGRFHWAYCKSGALPRGSLKRLSW